MKFNIEKQAQPTKKNCYDCGQEFEKTPRNSYQDFRAITRCPECRKKNGRKTYRTKPYTWAQPKYHPIIEKYLYQRQPG